MFVGSEYGDAALVSLGAVTKIDRLFPKGFSFPIANRGRNKDAAYAEARRQESGDSVVVGVNRFSLDTESPIPVLSVDPAG